MTYCLGIKVEQGLVMLADGRITAGHQVSNARKATLHGPTGAPVAIMTSGLRSLRDKTLAYFDRDQRRERKNGFGSMLEAVTAYSAALREVAEEDREALERSELSFNLNAILGGCLADDPEPTLFLVYPEGNWIEVDARTPYLSVGATAYGKPILDRALGYTTSLRTALKLAYLSFDSTRFSSADVGYPIDLLTYRQRDRLWSEAQYDYDDLSQQRQWWNKHITQLAADMPDGPWTEVLLAADDLPDEGQRLSLVQQD
ncbi:peptidase [Algihabitans sp.]|uniref:peptidase n=1 Tax=Algihabitans sp. TaxID=2821514 RepID=UPI003BAB788F